MKITEVSVHNYRGIIDQTIRLEPYSLLLGSNNAGKSTVLAAICAFYEHDPFKYKSKRDRPHAGASDNETWVELEFVLDNDEAKTLKEEYLLDGSRMRVRHYLESPELAHDSKPRTGARYAYTRDGLTHADFYYGVRNVGKGKLGSLIYIPAVSRVEEHTKLSGPSALRDLLNEILKSIVSSSKAFDFLEVAFDDFSTTIRDEPTPGGRSIEGLEQAITDSLSDWGTKFHIFVRAPDATELVKSLTDYSITEEGSLNSLPAEEFGSGFQRNLVFTLINVRASYTEPTQAPKKKTFSPQMTVMLFEEPEAFLHPAQQERLSDSLRSVACQSGQQVICSTHSPHFVSYNVTDIRAITRLDRSNRVVLAYQITVDDWDQIVALNDPDNEDDAEAAEKIRYFLWLNPDRCGAFFSQRVLLVEGSTDQVVLRRLVRDGHLPCTPAGLHVLDAMGKWNIPRFSRLLSKLGVPHHILFDEDAKTPNHLEINGQIRALLSDAFVIGVVSLAQDLETSLKIPASKRKSQKPARALRAYESGEIDDEDLRVFCALVSAAFPSDG